MYFRAGSPRRGRDAGTDRLTLSFDHTACSFELDVAAVGAADPRLVRTITAWRPRPLDLPGRPLALLDDDAPRLASGGACPRT